MGFIGLKSHAVLQLLAGGRKLCCRLLFYKCITRSTVHVQDKIKNVRVSQYINHRTYFPPPSPPLHVKVCIKDLKGPLLEPAQACHHPQKFQTCCGLLHDHPIE